MCSMAGSCCPSPSSLLPVGFRANVLCLICLFSCCLNVSLVSSILLQPQSTAHPPRPDSSHYFPTIHERPISFSPPPTVSPMASSSQRRKSTSFLESQVRHHGQPPVRTLSPIPPLDGTSAQRITNLRHDGAGDSQTRPAEAIYLASVPYNIQAEAYGTAAATGQPNEPMMAQIGSVYNYQTGQTYLTRPVLRLETGAAQPSALGSMSAPVTAEPQIMFHQVFMPQSAPPVLAQGTEGQPSCVFEFHVHSSGPEGAVYVPHRVYCARCASGGIEEVSYSALLQNRLQTVTEELNGPLGPAPRCPLICNRPEYSNDSSQRDCREYLSLLPPGSSQKPEMPMMYPLKLPQDPPVVFCVPPSGVTCAAQTTIYGPQVISYVFHHRGAGKTDPTSHTAAMLDQTGPRTTVG
ncbi:uncharacterized protein LOC143777071 [Ranitomeya variabilis]|uniref:uncharacterized protein LOC143777071 n=1 Tax=Ranitomeya variabilis TaxID=490064 RepID=UPI00405750E2